MLMNLIFPFAVNWEILRSGFNNTLDGALEADTYGEQWVLELGANERIILKTPRGSARVVGLKTNPDPNNHAPFDVLVIKESDLSRILGIDDDDTPLVARDVLMDFTSQATEDQRITFQANPKYFVSVNLRFLF